MTKLKRRYGASHTKMIWNGNMLHTHCFDKHVLVEPRIALLRFNVSFAQENVLLGNITV